MKGAGVDKHAKAYINKTFPAYQFAGKMIIRTPEGPRMRSEDLFDGCFDAVCIDPGSGHVLCVQWTTDNRGNLSYRRRKIEDRFLGPLGAVGMDPTLCITLKIELWAYMARKCQFRVEEFDWASGEWKKTPRMIVSPLKKRRGKLPSSRQGT
jgi:hypothetical protein